MKKLLFLALFLLPACKDLPYKSDVGAITSYSARSPEYLVYIGQEPCRDLNGIIGLCSVRVKRDAPFIIMIPPQQYAYRVQFDCTNTVQPGGPETKDILPNTPVSFSVQSTSYGSEELFLCSVGIFPLDRPEPIASYARITVSIIDPVYSRLPAPYQDSKGTVFGQNSHYVMWYDGKVWHYDTMLTWTNRAVTFAFVESYSQRFNQYPAQIGIGYYGQ